ncbi:MAG: aspartate kinase [Erysipelotrichaceae bacterium]|nr:aspartate kinase [Erysipelotrichaceae bacterium]
MKVIVQKFGGTSTRNIETREHMYKNIIREINKGNKVVAVVSAMGRYDDPYATDTLLSIVKKDELTDEEIDRLSSIGETLSTLVIKSELSAKGYNVSTVTNRELGIITNEHHTSATITTVEGKYILKKLESSDIVVCPGFQGYAQNGTITTLGRGGSDLSAVAIGVAIDACEVEIYSDVKGIYTADPRIVSDARKLDYISYAEMLELSKNGAKVLNHRCVLLAAKNNIVIHARSSFDESQGTYVLGDEKIMKDHLNELIISGITGSQNEARITLAGVDAKGCGAGQLFERIADEDVNVNVFNQVLVGGGRMDISLIINDKYVPIVVDIINDLKPILKPQKTIVRGNIGKVAVVGVGIKNNKGMYQKVYNTLMSHGINVEMTSCSEINISCYIDRDDVQEAQVLLHEAFLGG